jgi:Raf kinase inhibitor-like YbhB/YbcL family protein
MTRRKKESGELAVPPSPRRPRPPARIIEIASSAFGNGQRLPPEYTQDGADVSPPLAWSRFPEGTRSIAVVMEDSDAPTERPWVHWVLYNVPPFVAELGVPLTALPEDISRTERPREIPGAVQGRNDFGTVGYRGPSGLHGHETHHYHFRVYALDSMLDVPAGATKAELMRALQGKVLGTGEIIGTYSG